MNNSFFKSIILTFIFISSLFASNEEINQKLFELKTSQEYAQKINDEKVTLIMGQIIQKENEIKELEKELNEYVNKEDLQKEITYQNNRIEDINSSVDKLSVIVSASIGLFGVLITAVVIFFAFKFERIAKFKAEEEVKSWIDEKAQKVFNNIVEESKKELEEKAEKELSNIKNETSDKIDEFIDGLNDRSDLKRKEKDYKDIFKIVIENYKNNNIEKAITNIKDAIQLAENDKNKIQALFTHALLLGQLNRSEEAIEVYDEIVKRFEDSKDNNILEEVAKALVNKGSEFLKLDKDEKAIEVYDEVVKRLEDSKDNNILEKVSSALVSKGVTLGQLNRSEEAIEVYDEVVKRFEDSKDNSILKNVVKALFNKGVRLGQLNKSKEEIEVYDEVVKRFEDSKDNSILKNVASALHNKGVRLGHLNRIEESIEVYDEVVKRFEDSKDNSILEKVASALHNKGVTLGHLNRSEEAIEVYDKVVKRFEDSKNNSILEKVSSALHNKGITLGHLNRSEESIEVYDEVVKRFEYSKDNSILEQIARALINKIETNLILNKLNSQKDLNLYSKLVKDDKSELIQYKMLTLLEKAKDSNIDNRIEEWKEEFKGTSLKNWSFSELKDWANSFEDKELKERLLRYIDIFENHNKK